MQLYWSQPTFQRDLDKVSFNEILVYSFLFTPLLATLFCKWRATCREFSILVCNCKHLILFCNVFETWDSIHVAKQGNSLPSMTCFTALNMLGTFMRVTLPHRKWELVQFYAYISLVCFLAKTKEYNIFPSSEPRATGFARSSLSCPKQLFFELVLLVSQFYKKRNYSKP